MKNRIRKILTSFMILAVVMISGTVMSFAAEPDSAAPDLPAQKPEVMLNGSYMTFEDDSQPRNINDRIMVPYRAILEALGATVGYDESTGVISGSVDGISLTMKNGDYDITISYADGTSKVITMDVAPYIEEGRTFVPVRFVSEVLEHAVGWDSVNETVIIIDVQEIFANANEDFSIYMKVNNDMAADMNKTYDVKGNIDASVEVQSGIDGAPVLPAETTTAGISLTGDISGRVQGLNEELSMNIHMDADGEITDTNAEVKFDGSTGDMYMKADNVTENGQWLKLNLYDMYDMLSAGGMDIKSLMESSAQGVVDMKEVLTETFDMATETYDIYSYLTIKASYEMMKAMYGNEAFVKTDSGYTMEFDGESIAEAAASVSGIDKETMMDNMGLKDAQMTGNMTINTDENDKATDCSMGFIIETPEMVMDILCEASTLETAIVMGIDATDVMELALGMNIVMEESSGTVNTAIPEGETAVDINELLSGLMQSQLM